MLDVLLVEDEAFADLVPRRKKGRRTRRKPERGGGGGRGEGNVAKCLTQCGITSVPLVLKSK